MRTFLFCYMLLRVWLEFQYFYNMESFNQLKLETIGTYSGNTYYCCSENVSHPDTTLSYHIESVVLQSC